MTKHTSSHRNKYAALLTTFALAIGSLSSVGQETPAETAKILAANQEFYSALNEMFTGKLDAMKELWSHADDVTYMGPTANYERGWAAVLKDWEGQAALKLGGKVTPTNVQVIAGHDVAVVTDIEMGENTNAQGKVEKIKLRATNIYRKEDGKWRMVGHHTDPLPYLDRTAAGQ